MLTYETLMAVKVVLDREPTSNFYLTADVYDLGVTMGYDMGAYIRIEPTMMPTPTQPTAHYKHYMKFQKAKRKRR